jgi:hypothetical protein
MEKSKLLGLLMACTCISVNLKAMEHQVSTEEKAQGKELTPEEKAAVDAIIYNENIYKEQGLSSDQALAKFCSGENSESLESMDKALERCNCVLKYISELKMEKYADPVMTKLLTYLETQVPRYTVGINIQRNKTYSNYQKMVEAAGIYELSHLESIDKGDLAEEINRLERDKWPLTDEVENLKKPKAKSEMYSDYDLGTNVLKEKELELLKLRAKIKFGTVILNKEKPYALPIYNNFKKVMSDLASK